MRYLQMIIGLTLMGTLLAGCGKENGPTEPSIPDPIASFIESGGTVTPAIIEFQNTSQNADSYLWRFGDGDSTTITNPTHTYDIHGNYSVTLIARNSATGRSDIELKQISITPGKVFLEAIIVNDIPFTDSYGAGWDLMSGPDLFPEFVNITTTILSGRSNYFPDAAPSDLPIGWTVSPVYEIQNWTESYSVLLWDYDDFGDDFIGVAGLFQINDIIAQNGYTTSVTRQNSEGTVSVSLTLGWQ